MRCDKSGMMEDTWNIDVWWKHGCWFLPLNWLIGETNITRTVETRHDLKTL